MKIRPAEIGELEQVIHFYRYVIAHSPNMEIYARWIYGLHPNDALLSRFVSSGSLYILEENAEILASVAITPQEEDYHETEWALQAADDKVFCLHIFCVSPDRTGQGLARAVMQDIFSLARSRGIPAIRLDTLASNLPAQKMYASFGFQLKDRKHWYASNIGWDDFLLYEYVL